MSAGACRDGARDIPKLDTGEPIPLRLKKEVGLPHRVVLSAHPAVVVRLEWGSEAVAVPVVSFAAQPAGRREVREAPVSPAQATRKRCRAE